MVRYIGRWWTAILLGLATIGAYGTAYYSIGVLIPVIADDTGWSTGSLSAGFSLGALGQGGIALLAGRTFDRHGSLPVLLPSLVGGCLLLALASFAAAPWQYVAAWALGAAAIGRGLFYNITMPVTARLYPQNRAAAFSVLTLVGALASPIFYPVAGWLSEEFGWRVALRGLVALTAVCVAPAALLVRAPGAPGPAGFSAANSGLRQALAEPVIQRALITFALVGLANSAVLLHQVAALEAAGLSIAAAAGFAGARGAFQIPGRLMLTPLVSRFGLRGAIALCYGVAASGTAALLIAVSGGASTVMAAYFAAMSGMSLGLLSPLTGLFQAEVYGDARLGTLSGAGVIVGSIAAAAGGWLAGVSADVTGSFHASLAAVTLLQVVAIGALMWQGAAAASISGGAAADSGAAIERVT